MFGIERAWLVADRLWPPFVNQLVVQGEATPDPDAWSRALATVLPRWPAVGARLRGVVSLARWSADGPPPRLSVVDGDLGTPGHPALSQPLDGRTGPVVEVVLGPGHVVLRTHHALFDGRAAWALAEDLGAALRGAPVRGAAFAEVREPASTPGVQATGDVPLGVYGPVDLTAPPRWTRRTLTTPTRGLVPRVALGLSRARGEALRISVPVDLRAPGDRVAANLTGFVRVAVAPTDDVADVDLRLRAALASEQARASVAAADGLRHVPLWVLGALAGRSARAELATGRGRSSAAVSNLGRQDAGVVDGAGFVGRALWWIPPTNPGSPCFLTLTGHGRGVELCVGLAAGLGASGRLEALADVLALGLSSPLPQRGGQ
ncbi:MAG: hypothetical protein EXR71_12380 [Myxococcales bacterium]|nr:hypothetical protein [Myxococcales bacterium]